ncbi:uncharacterized protein LOC142235211 [Haematobia irritans]|uniref:uncharacterized protein LOC142235211 n=1 Tax=Haematobia irritans TaxID=7368 RepID=UPI003F50B3BD
MFKLVVLFALVAMAMANPSTLLSGSPYVSYGHPVAVHQPSYATVGSVVRTVPTSVSHSSHAVVHKAANLVQDVVAPVVRTSYVSPALRTVHSPLYHSGYVSSSYPYGSYGSYGVHPSSYTSSW